VEKLDTTRVSGIGDLSCGISLGKGPAR